MASIRHAQQTLDRVAADTGIEWRDAPLSAVRHIITEYRPHYSPRYWHSLSRRLVDYLRGEGPVEAIALLRAAPPPTPQRTGRTQRAARARLRGLSDEDLRSLVIQLRVRAYESDSDYAMLTAEWLTATRVAGLRPSEWLQAHWLDEDQKQLVVVDGKRHDQRAGAGSGRVLDFRDTAATHPAIIDAVRTFVAHLDRTLETAPFERVYRGCRTALLRANRALWPDADKTITLLSARHQAKLDLAQLTPYSDRVENMAATTLGHSARAHKHYGRDGIPPLPTQAWPMPQGFRFEFSGGQVHGAARAAASARVPAEE